MSALSAFTPPPLPDYYAKENALFAFAEAVAAGRRPKECNGVWLGRMPARQTLYHTLVQVCGRPSNECASQIIREICLTIGGFDQVDRFGLT